MEINMICPFAGPDMPGCNCPIKLENVRGSLAWVIMEVDLKILMGKLTLLEFLPMIL